jgi:hypothetical protein
MAGVRVPAEIHGDQPLRLMLSVEAPDGSGPVFIAGFPTEIKEPRA